MFGIPMLSPNLISCVHAGINTILCIKIYFMVMRYNAYLFLISSINYYLHIESELL